MTPTPAAANDTVFDLGPAAANASATNVSHSGSGGADDVSLRRGAGEPLAESTPLSLSVDGKEERPPTSGDDADRTPMPSTSGAVVEPPTPTPPQQQQQELALAKAFSPLPLTSASASNSPARKVPVRNLQSLFVEKSELHISFMGQHDKAAGSGHKASAAAASKRASAPPGGVSGSTFSVDSRLSTETEEDAEDCLEEEATSTEDEEDFSGLLTFFQLARKAGLTSRLGARPNPPSCNAGAVSAAPQQQRSSTLSLPQGGQQGEADTTSMTSRGSADNALTAVSNFKRQASNRLKDAASRFSQKMASMRQQWNQPGAGGPGGGLSMSQHHQQHLQQQAGGLNRSTGELRSNALGSTATSTAPPTASWLSTSMRRLRVSQESALGGAGSMGEDSDDDDSDSSSTPCKLKDVWKLISGVGLATSPMSSHTSSRGPSVGSTPTSPVEESAPTQRRSSTPPLLLVRLSSCSSCVQCKSLIYDEDIMNGWTHESSNLNTRCPYCENPTLPRLTISLVVETEGGRRVAEEHMTTLYLSPLALRKVMETVFLAESSDCLQQVDVIDAHPELFWNYLWYLTRLHLPNHLLHLVGLWWSGRRGRAQCYRVRVELKWDSWTLLNDEVGLKPLYRIWAEKSNCDETDPMHPVVKHMQRILEHIKLTDMNAALRLFLEERHVKVTDRSAYREILFLSIQALGRANINIDSFVYFYTDAYKQAFERNQRLEKCDKPPDRGVIWCRTLFPVLDL